VGFKRIQKSLSNQNDRVGGSDCQSLQVQEVMNEELAELRTSSGSKWLLSVHRVSPRRSDWRIVPRVLTRVHHWLVSVLTVCPSTQRPRRTKNRPLIACRRQREGDLASAPLRSRADVSHNVKDTTPTAVSPVCPIVFGSLTASEINGLATSINRSESYANTGLL